MRKILPKLIEIIEIIFSSFQKNKRKIVLILVIFIGIIPLLINLIRPDTPSCINVVTEEQQIINLNISFSEINTKSSKVKFDISGYPDQYFIDTLGVEQFCIFYYSIYDLSRESIDYWDSKQTASYVYSSDDNEYCIGKDYRQEEDFDVYDSFAFYKKYELSNSGDIYIDSEGEKIYPYDKVFGKYITSLEGYYKHPEGKSLLFRIPVKVSTCLDFQDWEIDSYHSSIKENYIVIDFVLKRPFLYRYLTPLLLMLAGIFTIYLLIEKNDEIAIKSSITLLFGLWGIREVIVDKSIKNPESLNLIFGFIYLLIFIFTLKRLVNLIQKNKKSP